MKIRIGFIAVFTLVALSITSCGDTTVDTETRAEILMLEDQRNADMEQFSIWLQDENPAVRARACLALGRIGMQNQPDDEIRSALLKQIKDKNANVREMAAFALGEIEDSESVDPLIALLLDSEPLVRASAAEALSKIGNEQAAIALAKIIASDPVEHVRARALLTSFRLNDERTAKEAMRILKDGPSGLIWPAAYHFQRHRGAANMDWDPAVVTRLSESENPEVRKAAAKYLVYLRDAGSISSIFDALLLDKDMYVQINALRAAGRMAYPGAIPILLQYHETAAAQVRQEMAGTAAAMLRSMSENEMVNSQEYQDVLLVLRNLVNDDVQAVAADALDGLAALGAEAAALVDLDALLKDPRPYVRAAALNLLSYSDLEKQKTAINSALADESSFVQIAAAQKVTGLEDEQFVSQTVADLLQSNDQVLVSLAATWFEQNGTIDDLDMLIAAYNRFTDNPDAEAIQSILSAIAAFSDDPRAEAVLDKALDSDHYQVRLTVARLLQEKRGDEVFEHVGKNDLGRDLEWYKHALTELKKYKGMLVKTEEGDIVMDFLPDAAPLTCYNFIELAAKNFFADTIIHRVIPDFVAQMGDPRGDGWGGPGYSIRCEINQELYEVGSVGMAHAGKDTGGSQLFITYAPMPHLDGRHTVFADVSEGMDIARKLTNGSALYTIELIPAK